jgi:predicted Zn-dependent protease
LSVALWLVGCAATPEEKRAEVVEDRAADIRDELAVGREMTAKLYGYFGKYSGSDGLLEYVNLVGQTIASRYGRPDLVYRFGILDTPEVNAFAAPGGFVLVTRGLLGQIHSESELACVLGHEIAHINEKHMYLRLMPKHEVSAEESVARLMSRGHSDLGKSLTVLADEGLKTLLEDGIGLDKEKEADEAGVIFAASLGYNPHEFVSLLQRLQTGAANLKFGKVAQPFPARIAGLTQFFKDNGIPNKLVADGKTLDQRFARAWGLLASAK